MSRLLTKSAHAFRSGSTIIRPTTTDSRSRVLQVDTLLAGGGPGATRVLHELGQRNLGGKTLIVAEGRPWYHSLPRGFQLGQSQKSLRTHPEQLAQPNQKTTVEQFHNDIVTEQIQAIDSFPADALDLEEASVAKILSAEAGRVVAVLTNGTTVIARRAIWAAGVGPERTIESAAVPVDNAPIGKRALQLESTTLLKRLDAGITELRGKSVAVFGGGASGAWIVELLLMAGVAEARWIGDSFKDANPGGRNNDTMKESESFRTEGTLARVIFQGRRDEPNDGEGLKLLVQPNGPRHVETITADFLVAAIGADPLAPLGIRSVLGTSIYGSLEARYGTGKGVVAANPSNSLIVLSSSVAGDSRLKGPIDGIFQQLTKENLPPEGTEVTSIQQQRAEENNVGAGAVVTRLSATAAVDLVASSTKA